MTSWIKDALSEIRLPKMKKKTPDGQLPPVPLAPLPKYAEVQPVAPVQVPAPVPPQQPVAPAEPVQQPAPQEGQQQVEVTIEDVVVDIHKQITEMKRDFDAYLRLKLK